MGENHWTEREREKEERKSESQCYQWPAMLVNATMGGACKPPGPIYLVIILCILSLLSPVVSLFRLYHIHTFDYSPSDKTININQLGIVHIIAD